MTQSTPIQNLPFKYVTDLPVAYATATTLTLGLGQARDSTNTYDIKVDAALTLNTAVSGAGGLDTGAIANNTTYGVYVLFDPSGALVTSCLLSASLTAPLMPSVNNTQYGAFRLVDFVQTNGSAQILPFINTGKNSERFKQYVTPIAVSTGGTATSYTSLPLALAVPLDTTVNRIGKVKFQYLFAPAAASNLFKLKPTGGAADVVVVTAQVSAVNIDGQVDLLPVGNSVDYLVSAGSETLQVIGYDFSL